MEDPATSDPVVSDKAIPAPSWLKPLAIISGLGAMLLFILVPFMPVHQQQSSVHWPQNDSLNSVNAPLQSYTPQEFNADIPISAIDYLRSEQNLVLGTLPVDSQNAVSRGLFVTSTNNNLEVSLRNAVVFSLSAAEVAELPSDAILEIHSTETGTTVAIPGATIDGEEVAISLDSDERPILSGIYTEIANTDSAVNALTSAGISAHVEINSRFTSSPTLLKSITMYLGVALLLVSLYCLWRIDRLDGRNVRSLVTKRNLRPTPLDGIVIAILGFWHIFGANTSDDGFIFTMARASQDSTYMANYYRWFGAPESPFGAPYYDLLAAMMHVSTASIWLRLPALLAGLLIWFLLSRQVLPRLGAGIAERRVAQWTAAFMFLAFWLPYNNGLRPEPIIALGALATWAFLEMAIANRRLFPAAMSVMTAAFTLTCGPTGLIAVAALFAVLSAVIVLFYQRIPILSAGQDKVTPWSNALAQLGPILAAGTVVLVPVFADQTISTVLASTRVRTEIGPSLPWYQEFDRYTALFATAAPDGSVSRRFAVIFTFFSIALVLTAIFRFGKVPGSNYRPSVRLLLVIFGSMFFMMFTPTKWTHHFGIWAGIGAAIAGLAAVALSHIGMRSARNRTVLFGFMLLAFALSLAGINGWWYVSSYAVPWFDKLPQFKAVEFATVTLILALLVLFIGVVFAFIQDFRKVQHPEKESVQPAPKKYAGLIAAPIALAAIASVALSSASLAKGFVSQYPAYTVGLGNVRSFAGETCALADYVLVESDTNDSFLTPVNSELGDSLESADDDARGFSSTKVPTEISSDTSRRDSSTSSMDLLDDEEQAQSEELAASESTQTERQEVEGINGSNISLPFGIDYTTVPVLGSWSADTQEYAEITTDWYYLPSYTEDAPVLVVSAAGSIAYEDINGVAQDGETLVAEYGVLDESGETTVLGEFQFDQPEEQPQWRNLRIDLQEFPEEANVVRLYARDSNLDPNQWIAFTPPRVPTMATLNETVGSESPVLLDWQVPLQFPCQRPFGHYAGVAEPADYRISADAAGLSGASFQDALGGGATGVAEFTRYSYKLATYLKDDWRRDWGSLSVYVPRTNSRGDIPVDAEIDIVEETRSGLWNPGGMNVDVAE